MDPERLAAPRLRIRWAPKLRADKLARLYQTDAEGRRDDELLVDVGWTIYFRLRDVLHVTASQVVCPACTELFTVQSRGVLPDRVSACPACGWEVTAGQYHRSWEHQDLNGSCDEFVFYVERFPNAASSTERMLLVDRVVHALHRDARGALPNFAARNFLEGTRPTIAALLDRLAAGPESTVADEARAQWHEVKEQYDAERRR